MGILVSTWIHRRHERGIPSVIQRWTNESHSRLEIYARSWWEFCGVAHLYSVLPGVQRPLIFSNEPGGTKHFKMGCAAAWYKEAIDRSFRRQRPCPCIHFSCKGAGDFLKTWISWKRITCSERWERKDWLESIWLSVDTNRKEHSCSIAKTRRTGESSEFPTW